MRLPSLMLCAALGGCVSADLGDIAPPSYAPGPAVSARTIDAGSGDVAEAPQPPEETLATAEGVEVEADREPVAAAAFAPPPRSGGASVDALIGKYAAHYGLREEFVRRVVKRESTFNPRAYNKGHWGLMQIKHQTARTMGYRGPAEGLLDAETNLIYAVKYLRGAWLVAKGDEAYADRLYQSGYYYHAKRAGLLEETGLGRDRVRKRRKGA